MTRTGIGIATQTVVVGRLVAREEDGIARRGEPVRTGIPLAAGAVHRPETLALIDESGARIAIQTEILDRWPDGSVRWLLLDFALDLDARAESVLSLCDEGDAVAAGGDDALGDGATVQVRSTPSGVFVDTGAVQFALEPGAICPFRSARAAGVELLDGGTALACRDSNGRVFTGAVDAIRVETSGPLRATVRMDGAFRDGGDTEPLRLGLRAHFTAGCATSRVEITVRNPRRAAHPNGHWELGDAGSFRFEDLSLHVRLRAASRVSYSVDPATPLADAGPVRLELYQDSSGGENWRSPVHRTRDGSIASTFRGYRVTVDGVERSGNRATPRVAVHDGRAGVGASVRHFWQNFPKAVEAADGVLTLRLFPGQFGAAHELQGGEQKTHEVALTFGMDALAGSVDAFRRPLVVRPDVATFTGAGVFPYLVPADRDPSERYRRLVAQAVEGADTFERKRERADEWGWRNFGDTWADHEAAKHRGDETFVSHHNNQYDVVYGALLQFARTGDARWHTIAGELAAHVADIDVYHTIEDKPAYNGGLFWHTAHYVDADLSTHRSYPKRGSCGGGPDNEHNYATGLAHWYYLTGDPRFRDAAIGLAEWVLRRDDGEATVLRHLDRGATGLATKTRDFDYHGPGRGAGNSIQVLLDAWRLTGDDRFANMCREVLRRTIHPHDDVAARDLLDAENRWSYTVHLQAVGRYLDEMAAAGRLDEDYAYARESLLAYARWMRDHERPSLDHPEALEHPTETWAVQDIRKHEVFLFAALHSRGEERAGFLQASERFYEPMLEKLDTFDTKSRLRPVVLLMRYGLMASWMHEQPDDERPPGPDGIDFGEPEPFVPQKMRAIAKLKRLAIGGSVLLMAGAAALIWRWLA